jgi:N-acetylglutamate synthase-like GNAT family acetyltransferase
MINSNPEGTPSLSAFLAADRRNIWLHSDKMKVYVRKGKHSLDNKISDCLDIASIQVEDEFQGHGIFKSWLRYAEDTATRFSIEAVFVENILNPRLATYLSGIGYRRQAGVDVNMFKFMRSNINEL